MSKPNKVLVFRLLYALHDPTMDSRTENQYRARWKEQRDSDTVTTKEWQSEIRHFSPRVAGVNMAIGLTREADARHPGLLLPSASWLLYFG